jgi:hypothetical protein
MEPCAVSIAGHGSSPVASGLPTIPLHLLRRGPANVLHVPFQGCSTQISAVVRSPGQGIVGAAFVTLFSGSPGPRRPAPQSVSLSGPGILQPDLLPRRTYSELRTNSAEIPVAIFRDKGKVFVSDADYFIQKTPADGSSALTAHLEKIGVPG